MTAESSDMNALSINVPITRSLHRLLVRAAMDRGLASEALAQRILREWLLAEGGFAQAANSSRPRNGKMRTDDVRNN